MPHVYEGKLARHYTETEWNTFNNYNVVPEEKQTNVTGEVVPVHSTKGYVGTKGIIPLILYHGTREVNS
jgi:hypothetical protein